MSAGSRRREVLVTGVGLHCAHGDGEATWAAIREGRSAVVPHRTAEADGFPELAAAPAPPWSLDGLVTDRKIQKYMSPAAGLAVAAAGRALRDAGLLGDAERCAGLALFAATGHIGFDLGQVTRSMASAGAGEGPIDGERMARGLSLCHPLLPFRMLLNMPLGLVSIAYGIRGENAILYPGPLQGGMALELAHEAVASGRCERALAGGSVHGLALMPLALSWRAGSAGALPPTDAGAFVVLESAEAAGERGARSRARLLEVKALPDGGARAARAHREAGPSGLLLCSGTLVGPDRPGPASAAGPDEVVDVDALVGHPGAAAPALLAGLAALAAGRAGRVRIAARDPDGGLVLATVAGSSPEGAA